METKEQKPWYHGVKWDNFYRYDPGTGQFFRKTPSARASLGAQSGSRTTTGYSDISFNGRYVKAHRLAFWFMTGSFPDSWVDHINGNRADNRWANLRLATPQQNAANSRLRKDNVSGIKGACYLKRRGKWQAKIRVNGRDIYLGIFNAPEAAGAAYQKAAEKHFGQFARSQ